LATTDFWSLTGLPGLAAGVVFTLPLTDGLIACFNSRRITIVGAAPEIVPLGYAAFSALMMIGRFRGDGLTARFKRVALVRFGGTIAALGVLLLLAWPMPWSTIGYSAFLAGPPIIGLLAHETSLRAALILILVLLATLIYTARVLRRA